MKIVIGCDVDPELPLYLTSRPAENVWDCLRNLDELLRRIGDDLPPVTWLIRSDESVRFATGTYDSGYNERRVFWNSLRERGHELGWHMHLASYNTVKRCFGFDRNPDWLVDAHTALSLHYPVRSTRTGWDYANTELIKRLDKLGVAVDFSALPGSVAWFRMGADRFKVDWLRCPNTPYHPSGEDFQKPGSLRLLEIPITLFRHSNLAVARRLLWRSANRVFSVSGLTRTTRKLTDTWAGLPVSESPVWAFYFHPSDLGQPDGYENFCRNVAMLRELDGAEFVTASVANATWQG